MALDTYIVFANQYDGEADARADYDAVRKLYMDLKLVDSYDAAILTRKADGKVDIVRRVEEPVVQGGALGMLLGLSLGTAVALYPALGVSAAAAIGGGSAIGAGSGALAGHIVGGMSRSDLKSLGELLDKGKFGLIVVAMVDLESKVDKTITRAKQRAKARLQADTKALKQELSALHV